MSFILNIFKSILFLYFSLYALYHVIIVVSPTFVRYVVFQNHVNFPFRNLTDPTVYSLTNVHNFYLDVEKEVRIGVWHYIPKPLPYDASVDSKRTLVEHFRTYFKKHDGKPVVIYMHGNDRDRGEYGRVQMCSILSNLGYHVFALDYRGYGDSTGEPSETGVVDDVLHLHNFIKSYQNQSVIHFWGHSLGTGIATHAAKILSEFNTPVKSVVLEAPFKNIADASEEYIISPLFLNNKWIIQKTREALIEADIKFNTAENILKINSKILIFHAEDDWFIPHDHSRELVKISREKRPSSFPPVRLIEISKLHAIGHNRLYSHQEIVPEIKKFIDE